MSSSHTSKNVMVTVLHLSMLLCYFFIDSYFSFSI
uniref:Uncharacterized protein n=1 Tax=Anguilla anguilla TaxID=7936 RepID=A0A0E9XUH9_ANGAN